MTIIREVGEPLALVVDYCLHLLCTIDSFLLVKHYLLEAPQHCMRDHVS